MARLLLLVEHDQDARDALAELFEHRGFAVLGAINAERAIDLLFTGRAHPDAIIAEVCEPEVDGSKWLRSFEAGLAPGIPLILYGGTASALPVPGAFASLQKPFEFDVLVNDVYRACGLIR